MTIKKCIVIIGGARDYHVMDWYRAVRSLEQDRDVRFLTDLIDEIVEVLDTIGPGESVGTITFRGTTWRALGDGREITKGSRARIVSRENTTYIVYPVAE
mgnify:CR=1 FL=1